MTEISRAEIIWIVERELGVEPSDKQKKLMKMRGRPVETTDEFAQRLCQQLYPDMNPANQEQVRAELARRMKLCVLDDLRMKELKANDHPTIEPGRL